MTSELLLAAVVRGNKSTSVKTVNLEGKKEEGMLEEKASGSVLCMFSRVKVKVVH